jgi:hypothetical protein
MTEQNFFHFVAVDERYGGITQDTDTEVAKLTDKVTFVGTGKALELASRNLTEIDGIEQELGVVDGTGHRDRY